MGLEDESLRIHWRGGFPTREHHLLLPLWVVWAHPDIPDLLFFFLCQRGCMSIQEKKGKFLLADCLLSACTQRNGKILSYQMTGEVWHFLSLPMLLPATSQRSASWACRSDLWTASKDNFQLCICMQLSVWATRQACRFRGRSICISEGSRCCIIKSNLEGK